MITSNVLGPTAVEDAPKKAKPTLEQAMKRMNSIAARMKKSRRKRNKYCLPR